MAESFNPYHKWLGIPLEEQPPNHYRLLGIKLLESDPEVIESAADQRMNHLRTYATGAHASDSQRLLNEVSSARVTLLDKFAKIAYDEKLKSQAAARPSVWGASKSASAGSTTPKSGPPSRRPPRRGSSDTGVQGTCGPYDLLQKVASAKSGDVWKARHQSLGKFVSLKLLPPEAAAMPEILQRFQREVKVSANLNHPHVVGALDAGEDSGKHYLVTELVEGTDLATLVSSQGPLSVEKATDYALQAAKGLAYLHANKIVHRNVKPSNLLLSVDGKVKVSNLILARVEDAETLADGLGEGLTLTGHMLGTSDYVAPEQALDASSVDARADIYSLGCTLHHLLTGKPPYVDKSIMKVLMAHRSAPIPSLVKARQDVPDDLNAVFQRMLAKQPDDRFGSMDDVVRALADTKPGGLPAYVWIIFWLAILGGAGWLGYSIYNGDIVLPKMPWESSVVPSNTSS